MYNKDISQQSVKQTNKKLFIEFTRFFTSNTNQQTRGDLKFIDIKFSSKNTVWIIFNNPQQLNVIDEEDVEYFIDDFISDLNRYDEVDEFTHYKFKPMYQSGSGYIDSRNLLIEMNYSDEEFEENVNSVAIRLNLELYKFN